MIVYHECTTGSIRSYETLRGDFFAKWVRLVESAKSQVHNNPFPQLQTISPSLCAQPHSFRVAVICGFLNQFNLILRLHSNFSVGIRRVTSLKLLISNIKFILHNRFNLEPRQFVNGSMDF
jgi:hypothetical protein